MHFYSGGIVHAGYLQEKEKGRVHSGWGFHTNQALQIKPMLTAKIYVILDKKCKHFNINQCEHHFYKIWIQYMDTTRHEMNKAKHLNVTHDRSKPLCLKRHVRHVTWMLMTDKLDCQLFN